MDQDDVSSHLKGNTLRVYWYLLQCCGGHSGTRDVQRNLGFSSPALAVYHLEKLVELGLARKNMGEYNLTKMVDVGILKQFAKFGRFIFPRYVLYASLWSTLFVFFLMQFRELNFYSLFALVFGVLGMIILWFEAVKIWQSKP